MVILFIIVLGVIALALIGRTSIERLKISTDNKTVDQTFNKGMNRVEYESRGKKIVANLFIPEAYKEVGQPVIIPGSMGTASYLLVGTEQALKESFGSTAHGAGRVMSRSAAIRQFRGEQVKKELKEHHIFVKSKSWKGICEEAPQVYKDVDEVVKVSHDAGIGNLVVRVRPLGVIKG